MKKLSPPLARPRRVTLKDVAARAGVGHPTASTVLSNSGAGKYVSDETRQRVLRVADELGYQPNQSARTMKTGSFGSVAYVLSTDTSRSGTEEYLIESVYDVLAAHDKHLMLVRLPDDSLADEAVMPRILREWTVDGLLVGLTVDAPPNMIELIRRHHIPAVWTNADQEIDCVRPDDERAGHMAAQHFLDLGHKRTAYVVQPGGHYSIAERKAGYVRAMREAGLQPQVLSLDWYYQEPRVQIEIVRSWLSSPDRPTAFIFYAHQTAILVYHLAGLMGLRIPEDFSMLCISDEMQRCLTIELDTVIIPFRELGASAVQKLMQKIDNPYVTFPVHRVPFNTIKRGQSSRSLLG